jgi:orotate phosphoribosyltransferase
MNLFEDKRFDSHSNLSLPYKIECNALSEADIDLLASLIAEKFKFRSVVGIETGGDRLTKCLVQYINTSSQTILIVDDVLTTGASMQNIRKAVIAKEKEKGNFYPDVHGVVIFSRMQYACVPRWITPVFQMSDEFAVSC